MQLDEDAEKVRLSSKNMLNIPCIEENKNHDTKEVKDGNGERKGDDR